MKFPFFVAFALFVALAVPVQSLSMADQPAPGQGGWFDGISNFVGGFVSWLGLGPKPANPLADFMNSVSLTTIFCSSFGWFAGFCSASSGILFALVGAVILVIFGILYVPTLIIMSEGAGAIVFAVVGAILGFAIGSILNLWWWALVLIMFLPKVFVPNLKVG